MQGESKWQTHQRKQVNSNKKQYRTESCYLLAYEHENSSVHSQSTKHEGAHALSIMGERWMLKGEKPKATEYCAIKQLKSYRVNLHVMMQHVGGKFNGLHRPHCQLLYLYEIFKINTIFDRLFMQHQMTHNSLLQLTQHSQIFHLTAFTQNMMHHLWNLQNEDCKAKFIL